MSHVFPRVFGRDLPTVARAEGACLWDTEGKRYLDAAGGAIVVGIGHGDADVTRALSEQAGRVAYAHGTQFTSETVEACLEGPLALQAFLRSFREALDAG